MRERPPSPDRAWQKLMGAQFEILPKPNTRVYKSTVPSLFQTNS